MPTTRNVEPNKPFTVRVAHDGLNTTAYRLYVDAALAQERPFSAWAGGLVDFPMPAGLPAARSYVLDAAAVNAQGESQHIETILVVTSPATVPNAPTTITILQG